MIKSMTGFSKIESREKGVTLSVEIKTLNGKYLETNCRIPKSISHKEFEIRDMIKTVLSRGNVFININIDNDVNAKPLNLNETLAVECYKSLQSLHRKLKLKDPLTFNNLLQFSNIFYTNDKDDSQELIWKITKNAVRDALKSLDKMRTNEGLQIIKDVQTRMKNISNTLSKVEDLGIKKIPAERDRLRQKVAQLFESDEIDEHRIQLELVLLADKLDVSEECVRLRSHIKFFYETLKAKEPVGRKINFLMQEMNREVNTIGSKANDTEMAHLVVGMKEELERIREQIQNIE